MPKINIRRIKKGLLFIKDWLSHRIDVAVLYVDWLSFGGRTIRKIAREQFDNNILIKPFHIRKWHNGTSCFLIEQSGKNIAFIKNSFNRLAIQAEVSAISHLANSGVNVCDIYKVFESDHNSFVIENYVQGVPLSDKKAICNFTVQDKRSILCDLLDIINRFYNFRFIHSDFTPKNIMILPDNKLHIIDFEYSVFQSNRDNAFGVELITKNKRKLRDLGNRYAMRNGIIDDGYSLLQIAKDLIPDIIDYDHELWNKLNLTIGRIQLDTDNKRIIVP